VIREQNSEVCHVYRQPAAIQSVRTVGTVPMCQRTCWNDSVLHTWNTAKMLY